MSDHPILELKARLAAMAEVAEKAGHPEAAADALRLYEELESFLQYASGAVRLLSDADVLIDLHTVEWRAQRHALVDIFIARYADVLASHQVKFTFTNEAIN